MSDDSSGVGIHTARLRLWMPSPRHAPAALDFMVRNREHLEPWSPPRAEDFYTLPYWTRQLERNRSDYAADRSARLFLSRRGEPDHMIGVCNLSEIIRGAFQACLLGYSLDHAAQGQGLMTEALRAVIKHAFEVMRLHRIMANYMPTNERSGAVLRRVGFAVEGYARDYLYIAGAWRDHVLTSFTNTALARPQR